VHLGDKVGNVGVNDLLHLLLDLLGEDTTAELLEESLVLGLEELGAATVSAGSRRSESSQVGSDRITHKDFSQVLILSTGTLSSIPLTPA
jgi:hypothetical protein